MDAKQGESNDNDAWTKRSVITAAGQLLKQQIGSDPGSSESGPVRPLARWPADRPAS